MRELTQQQLEYVSGAAVNPGFTNKGITEPPGQSAKSLDNPWTSGFPDGWIIADTGADWKPASA